MCDTAKALLKREMYNFKDKFHETHNLKVKQWVFIRRIPGKAQLRKSEGTKKKRK